MDRMYARRYELPGIHHQLTTSLDAVSYQKNPYSGYRRTVEIID